MKKAVPYLSAILLTAFGLLTLFAMSSNAFGMAGSISSGT